MEVLSRQEIDALLDAITATEAQETQGAQNQPAKQSYQRKVRIYDFRRPDKFTREHIRSLQFIFEDFACRLITLLPKGADIRCHTACIDQCLCEEFTRCIPSPGYTVLASEAESKNHKWVINIDNTICAAIVLLLTGKEIDPQSIVHICELSENEALRNFAQGVLGELQNAWAVVAETAFAIDKVEPHPDCLFAAPPNEMGVLISIEAKVKQAEGMINIFIPCSTLEKSRDSIWGAPYKRLHLKMEKCMPNEKTPSTNIKDIRVRLSALLGTAEYSIGDISDFQEGSIITLDKLAGSPVDVYAGNVKIAEAEVVVVDENFGLRLIDIVAQ